MRLYEFASNDTPGRSPEGVAATVVQFLNTRAEMYHDTGDEDHLTLSTNVVLKLLSNTGFNVGFEELQNLAEDDPALSNLIKSVDEKEVILKSGNEDDDFDDDEDGGDDSVEDAADAAAQKAEDDLNTVQGMASKATKKSI